MRSILETTLQDIRYAVRGLTRNPVFFLVAVLSGALGIGGASAVFSAVDRVLFRALPYENEEQLVSIGMMTPLDTNEFAFPDWYFQVRKNPGPLEEVTAYQAGAVATDLTQDNAVRLNAARVEANFLKLFRIQPVVGRSFTREEDRPNGPRVAMISYALWTSRFGADRNLVGRTVSFDGMPMEIVGVLPRNFTMPTRGTADVLIPLALNEATERSGRALRVFARLKPGISSSQANGLLQPLFERAMAAAPPEFRREISLRVRSLRDREMGDARAASLALLGSVLAVLLIASANIASLLLARAVAREKESAVRAALGAGRWCLVRQSLTESMIISASSAALGCALAWGLLRIFVAMSPSALPRLEEASIDMRALVFTVGAGLCSGLFFGVAPALRRPQLLLSKTGHATGRPRAGIRYSLVALQIAVSMVLLTGAGLMLRSLRNLDQAPLGMETGRVVVARFILGRQSYAGTDRQLAFFSELEQRIAAIPGMEAAAVSDSIPPLGVMRSRPLSAIEIEGRSRPEAGTGGMVGWRYVTPGYFATLGIPIVRGRAFAESDRNPDAFSAIVSESLARRMFPNEDPLGKRILRGPQGQWTTVIGVARDVTNDSATRESGPEYYIVRKPSEDFNYLNQAPPSGWRAAHVVARTWLDPSAAAGSIRAVMKSLDANLPVEIETMGQRMWEVDASSRFYAVLLGVFAAIGVLIAAVGLFGVTSFLVAQRTREIGVRLALGATRGRIVRMVFASVGLWTVVGVAIGFAGSFVTARVFRSLLFRVGPTDPAAIGLAVAVLGIAAVIAAGAPARKASRIDPIHSLRQE